MGGDYKDRGLLQKCMISGEPIGKGGCKEQDIFAGAVHLPVHLKMEQCEWGAFSSWKLAGS